MAQAIEKKERERRKEKDRRESEAAKRLAAAGEAAARRRDKAAHADAVANFRTLLSEIVRGADPRWADWWPRLQKDPQVCFPDPLS